MTNNIIFKYASTPIFMMLATGIVFTMPAFSDTAQTDNRKDDEPPKVVSIDGYVNMKQASPDNLGFTASYIERNGNNEDVALALCRKSLAKNDDDIDVHLQYARLLENKYREHGEPDPTLFMECVKEWLKILRCEMGDEKGMTFHGIGFPLTGSLFKDDDRTTLAKNHLIGLTGIGPKAWETDTKYLERVMKQPSVSAKLLTKQPQTAENLSTDK
jgi:hypothetical protein